MSVSIKKADILLIAKEYLRCGFSVIPLQSKGKKPVIPSWREFQKRLPTEEELASWFWNGSRNNIGIVSGAISRLAILDADSVEVVEWCETSLPQTPTVKTARGRHYYFKYKPGLKNSVNVNRLKLDVRGEGGYVVAPPSEHETGAVYHWVEDRSLDDLPLANLSKIILAKPCLDKTPIKELLEGIPAGQRNDSLARITGAMFAKGLDYDETLNLCLAWNPRNSPPLPEQEVKTTVESIFKKHRQNIKPEPENDAAAPFGPIAPIRLWLDTEPPPVDYLFENLLIRGITGGIFAAGGTGKTYLILCLMLSASLGKPSFRTFRPTRAMRVLGLLGEDPPDMIHRRIKNILGNFEDVDKVLLAENLRLYCGRPVPLMKLDNNNPIQTNAFEWLKNEVETFRPELIIVDPKSMHYGLDENNNDNNTQWINSLKELTSNGATVLFCHHVTKTLSGALELNGARGGSALADGSRFAANMRGLTEEDAKKYEIDEPWRYVEFKVTKNSYVPKLPGSVFFRFTHDGALEEVDLRATLESTMIDELLCSLQAEAANGNLYTAREVARSKTILPDATRKDRANIVKLALDSGRLVIETQRTGKTDKAMLVLPDNDTASNDGQDELDTVII